MKKILITIVFLMLLAFPVFSQSGFQMLEVDGIKVTIDEIRFMQGYADSKTMGSISVNKTVNLTGSLADVFNEATTLYLEFGVSELTFDTINIQLSGGVGIKGHTYLADSNTQVYTTSAGIKKILNSGSTWTAPSDYGYLQNDYIYYPGDGGERQETTFLRQETTFASDAALDMALLVDTYQVAYYWDGQDSTRHGFVDSWHQENTSYFPTGTPVIGITYLPLYLSVNQTLESETYVVAESASYLDPAAGDFYDVKYTMNMTLIFSDGGAFFIGRTANWDGLYATFRLPQFVMSAVSSGTDYDLTLSNYEDGMGWTDNSTVSGFTRQSVDGIDTFQFVDKYNVTHSLYAKRVK